MIRALRDDRRGVTAVEFGILAPVMLVLMLGLSDLMYQSYIQSVLDGAMIKAGRDSALEDNKVNDAEMDKRVKQMVLTLNPDAKFTPERKNYETFGNVKPENFSDKNGNNKYDAGECFDDVNGNKTWDADPGLTGQGSANDVTKYTMTVTYPRLFPIAPFLGWSSKMTISSTTLLKNQPYKTQVKTAVWNSCKP